MIYLKFGWIEKRLWCPNSMYCPLYLYHLLWWTEMGNTKLTNYLQIALGNMICRDTKYKSDDTPANRPSQSNDNHQEGSCTANHWGQSNISSVITKTSRDTGTGSEYTPTHYLSCILHELCELRWLYSGDPEWLLWRCAMGWVKKQKLGCGWVLADVNVELPLKLTRTSGGMGTLRHMTTVALSCCMSYPELHWSCCSYLEEAHGYLKSSWRS